MSGYIPTFPKCIHGLRGTNTTFYQLLLFLKAMQRTYQVFIGIFLRKVNPHLCKCILECLESALSYNSQIKCIFLYEFEVFLSAKDTCYGILY
jgi:hypothetical protein